MIEKMLSVKINNRPNCDEILKVKDLFSLNIIQFLNLKTDFTFNENINSMKRVFISTSLK
jgi:hypothetical protein